MRADAAQDVMRSSSSWKRRECWTNASRPISMRAIRCGHRLLRRQARIRNEQARGSAAERRVGLGDRTGDCEARRIRMLRAVVFLRAAAYLGTGSGETRGGVGGSEGASHG